uniref:Uncharacterized protein n=1 Tax=Anguilla anguilla TaxID=7936 RepID=A0A0E9SAC2_ANGAN
MYRHILLKKLHTAAFMCLFAFYFASTQFLDTDAFGSSMGQIYFKWCSF